MRTNLSNEKENAPEHKEILTIFSRRYSEEVEIHERKNKEACIIEYKNKKYFLKLEPTAKNIKNRISRLLIGGSIPFRNEIRINKWITANKKEYYPFVVETNSKDYILFENIEGSSKNIDLVSSRELIKLLLDIKDIKFNDDALCIEKLIRYYLLNHTMKTFKVILKSNRIERYRTKFRSIFLLLLLSINTKKTNKPFFVHGDLEFSNNNNFIITDNSKIYVIDFEFGVISKKWILIDIVDAIFDREELQLNFEILDCYKKNLFKDNYLTDSSTLYNQLRYAILRRVILIINSNKTLDTQRSKFIFFLENIVLEDKSFENWVRRYV